MGHMSYNWIFLIINYMVQILFLSPKSGLTISSLVFQHIYFFVDGTVKPV
jgi:hypothetical protein